MGVSKMGAEMDLVGAKLNEVLLPGREVRLDSIHLMGSARSERKEHASECDVFVLQLEMAFR